MFTSVSFQVSSLVRVCYANLTIQFELSPVLHRVFLRFFYKILRLFRRFYIFLRDTFLSGLGIQGIAVAYISQVSATEHEISISPEYEKYATRNFEFGIKLI